MTSNHKRLEELQQRAKDIAEQIEQLEEQLNNAQPTTGLLGLWATNRDGKRVLITTDRPVDGWIETTYVNPDGTTREKAEQLDSLSFPDQTTRPEDVPVGEAWLVSAHDGFDSQPNTPALKIGLDLWVTPIRGAADESEWHNHEITLITPLIPARPQDVPETVTTEEEYAQLPEGSIVAAPGSMPWTRRKYAWICRDDSLTTAALAGTTRHVLRWGR